jgi:LytS/YehU family sensor histidine kinase
MVILPFSFIDKWFAALFSFIALANLYSLMVQFAHERSKAMQSLRLEAQMLRRNLQPHFLMNSLTLIVEWVETEPKLAVKFIDALADEFRLLNLMSQQKLVPWLNEVALCQKHFEIMQYRYQKNIQLNIKVIESDFLVPPAIIHTIIENAFSHNRIKNGDSFDIQIKTTEKIDIKVITPFRNNNHQGSGIGEDYIKTRLTESFNHNWIFESAAKNDTWQTRIKFPLIKNVELDEGE